MITKDDYSIIIPTYKRSNRVITYNKLREQGYKGKIYLLIGDDDPQIEQYKQHSLSEHIHHSALYKVDSTYAFHLLQFQLQNFVGRTVQALYFLID